MDIVRNNKNVIFLYLGLLSQNKGVWDLLKAAFELKKDKINFHIIIGGNGDVEKLITTLNELNLNDYITYVGWVNGYEKNKLISTSNVFILPSYNEGVPISILEAMSYNLPIITTKVGGIPDVLKDNEAIFVDPGNINGLKEAMKFAVINIDYMNQLGMSLSLKIEDHYPESIKHNLLSIYSHI